VSTRKAPRARPSGTQIPLRGNMQPIQIGSKTHSQTTEVTDSQSGADGPRWTQLVRKEARLRPDQPDALARLRRQLSGKRADRREPLTDNTLIRIGIDLLLARAGELRGDTEEDLRRSLGLEPL
jgi:hypothetical protein